MHKLAMPIELLARCCVSDRAAMSGGAAIRRSGRLRRGVFRQNRHPTRQQVFNLRLSGMALTGAVVPAKVEDAPPVCL